jgi:two-component system chemotaxis response regulator CheB
MTPAVVVIGASAGGLAAMNRLLARLPAEFPAPLILVQHVKAGLRPRYEEIFRVPPGWHAAEAEEKQTPAPSGLYVAPGGYHLLVESDGSFSLSVEEAVRFARPSIDVFFETAADAYGPRLAAVILSGANDDGAAGLRAVATAGGMTVVQDPATAEFTAMPAAALEAVGTSLVLSPEGIGDLLASWTSPATAAPQSAVARKGGARDACE